MSARELRKLFGGLNEWFRALRTSSRVRNRPFQRCDLVWRWIKGRSERPATLEWALQLATPPRATPDGGMRLIHRFTAQQLPEPTGLRSGVCRGHDLSVVRGVESSTRPGGGLPR